MIEISIDDKACVSCALCVESCPTKVFEYNEVNDLPEVKQPKECFGCLSCSEICPATAISHKGLSQSECFYHDDYSLNMAGKMICTDPLRYGVIDSTSGLDKAMHDISVRLLSVGTVLKDIVGTGLPSVGLMAGRSLATQLPRYKPPKDFGEALLLARQEFAPAWDLEFSTDGESSVKVNIKECFVRELCSKENLPLGGELCTLFFHYLSGYLGKMAKAQLKLVDAQRGTTCSYEMKVLR